MIAHDNIIPITFALTPRMQSYLELRDALRCLQQAFEGNAPYAWLSAAKEVHDLLLGEGLKKVATPEVLSIFTSLQKHFEHLAAKHSQFKDKLNQACTEISQHSDNIRRDIHLAADFLCADAWLTTFEENIRKQDFLGHQSSLPQIINPLWFGHGKHGQRLNKILTSLHQAMEYLDTMLHSHVPWQQRLAQEGNDQITIPKHEDMDLMIVGLQADDLAQGIIPQYSGSRRSIRLRFNQCLPGQPIKHVEHDQNYTLMLVSIA
ncbi:MAG: hypothetical protein Q9M19_08890 [Mariprofundaceae bacterium]|nr:hypothetical protein [Mariprofundaceae bacterium]